MLETVLSALGELPWQNLVMPGEVGKTIDPVIGVRILWPKDTQLSQSEAGLGPQILGSLAYTPNCSTLSLLVTYTAAQSLSSW